MSNDETNTNAIEVLAERIARERELREKLERLIDERDLNYKDRIQVAIAAQKALTDAAFAASEKAILKSEESQREYNVRSNEFRGQLDDQAKTLMPRVETDGRFAALESKLNEVKEDVSGLRESRSALGGRSEGLSAGWGFVLGAIGLIGLLLTIGSVVYNLNRPAPVYNTPSK